MRPFKYERATKPEDAAKMVTANKSAEYLAGGTNIIDLMKEDVMRPDELVDVNNLSFKQIKSVGNMISIGAMAKNKDTANHPLIKQNFPLLTQAILAGASAQIRNMATNGGNLNQRTRCVYFYDTAMPCNKREPGTGCGAMEGLNRMHAIFGWSEKCIATHPSDMCVGLVALDAVVKVQDETGKTREIPFNDYHRLPGDSPEKDNNLKHGELITSIEIPKNKFANKSYYLKVRDRASYAFALVSVGVGLEMDGDTIRGARIAMGGVAHKPWRALIAEKMLIGKKPTEKLFEQAAKMEMERAKPLEHNKFKVVLGERAIVRALKMATNGGNS
ncbi:MAG: xanthine dehydrogenase family protein subunit M [Acidobacteriota bacterium]|jgi:xanthine dehydrogenase YagS FAD-binding subunit|nr:xanthine dehydrogenase family protein subunit M [Acidobacteriota bacterium]